jgi:hypothetical protein
MNSPLTDFIINNQGNYQIISSVHSVHTINRLHIQENLLTSEPQLAALYIVLHHLYTTRATTRCNNKKENMFSLYIGFL